MRLPCCSCTTSSSIQLSSHAVGVLVYYRGQKDDFVIEDVDLGELTAVTISHDNSGNSPSWHLDHIEMTPLGPPQQHQVPSNSSTNPRTTNSGSSSPLHMSQSLRNSTGSPTMQQALHARLLRDAGNSGSGVSAVASVTYLFPCGAWLDEHLGEGLTERKLLVAR
eukprot:GHUV01033298.1.p1 GENE.GHUV01033298.1~~GHUV01033298.1.p1  ORF type:complete len:165 (-),score=35.04 GHUV01033298.1:204-698(-)